jgi:hypothetical protein
MVGLANLNTLLLKNVYEFVICQEIMRENLKGRLITGKDGF